MWFSQLPWGWKESQGREVRSRPRRTGGEVQGPGHRVPVCLEPRRGSGISSGSYGSDILLGVQGVDESCRTPRKASGRPEQEIRLGNSNGRCHCCRASGSFFLFGSNSGLRCRSEVVAFAPAAPIRTVSFTSWTQQRPFAWAQPDPPVAPEPRETQDAAPVIGESQWVALVPANWN